MDMLAVQRDLAIQTEDKSGLYVLDMAMGYSVQAALRVAAMLGLADHLRDGPKTAAELGAATESEPRRLTQVLRLLCTREVFREDEQGRYHLTPAAENLRSDHPRSLRDAVMMITHPALWNSASQLIETVKGRSAFKKSSGMYFWEYWAKAEQDQEHFDVGMRSMSLPENEFLLAACEFPEHATVVDIAGGQGGMLLRVLQLNPTVRGILFDQQHVLPKHRLGELGDDSRWQLAAGDFFKEGDIPAGADIYTAKYITHDWADADAIRILRNVRKAMTKPGSKLLVMDAVIEPGSNKPDTGRVMDVVCAAIYASMERTEEEHRHILEQAGFRLNRIIDTGMYIKVVEAIPV
ncbi:methyltransferase [Cupriavidus gilardii]|uniref:methyltransferase n=1 Tax=Cupriavidus gilardii TaxID=82541 RepID=UPI001C2D315A|nr:methyltransferase [Cupriavidus gilardii]MCG5258982.1 hypothetical protein [Cupriavidus gilardii]